MVVVSSFEYSFHTELFVSELLERGIGQENILAIPLEVQQQPRQLLDTMHHSDGASMLDGGALLGTACMTLGVIYGFVLEWGPIIWGLIALIGGFILGCLLDFAFGGDKRSKSRQRKVMGKLIILINCRDDDQVEMVKKSLCSHRALGIAVIN